jgi:hypothetical protein
MLPLHPSRRIRYLALALFACAAVAVPGAFACLGYQGGEIWVCLNPVTGKEDPNTYDEGHYVHGVFDPCHCYDPCGPENSCPDVIDAGPLPPGCPVGDAGDGG